MRQEAAPQAPVLDVMSMRSLEPPELRVNAPETRGSGPTAYVVYKMTVRIYVCDLEGSRLQWHLRSLPPFQ